MLAYKKDWKIIDDSNAFSNAIRSIVFLIIDKWMNFYLNVFCVFSKWLWIRQYGSFGTKIDKFRETCCLLVFSPRIWNCNGCVLYQRIYCINKKKWERWPSNNLKVTFLFYFWVKSKSKHTFLSFKWHFKPIIYIKLAVWPRGIASVKGRIRSNYFIF